MTLSQIAFAIGLRGGDFNTEMIGEDTVAIMKQKILAYARMLAETGITLGVCECGICVYREEVSACHGSATAPNPVRRERST